MKPRSKDVARATADQIREALLAGGWVKVPPGWTLVPDQPTPEQLLAVSEMLKRARHPMIFVGDDEGVASMYFTMVKAAPSFASLFAQAVP